MGQCTLNVHSLVSLRSLGGGGENVFLGNVSCTGTGIGVVGLIGLGARVGVRAGGLRHHSGGSGSEKFVWVQGLKPGRHDDTLAKSCLNHLWSQKRDGKVA